MEAERKKKTGELPDGVKKELEALRNKVREIDITADPTLKLKYDDKIAANEEAVLKTLKSFGFGNDADGKEIPGFFDKLKAAGGVSLKTLAKTVKDLEAAGEVEAAEEVKQLLLQNSKLSKEKQAEIETFKANFEAVSKQRQEQEKQETVKHQKELEGAVADAVKETQSKFSFLKPPPAPLDTDAPAVKKAKEQAIAEFKAKTEEYGKHLLEATSNPVKGMKTLAGGLLLQNVVVPKLQSDLAAAQERIKALEAQIAAAKKAGAVRPQGGKPADDNGQSARESTGKRGVLESSDLIDSMAEAAKAAGINVNS